MDPGQMKKRWFTTNKAMYTFLELIGLEILALRLLWNKNK